jgi:hypothetical protein
VDFNRLAGQGLLWGAVNGVLFFSVLVLLVVMTLFSQPTAFGSPDAFGLFFYLLIGGVVASILGAVAGFLLAIVDSLLLFILRIIVRSIGMGKPP